MGITIKLYAPRMESSDYRAETVSAGGYTAERSVVDLRIDLIRDVAATVVSQRLQQQGAAPGPAVQLVRQQDPARMPGQPTLQPTATSRREAASGCVLWARELHADLAGSSASLQPVARLSGTTTVLQADPVAIGESEPVPVTVLRPASGGRFVRSERPGSGKVPPPARG